MCDRCVEGFDHHCIWINNCIGQRNYKIFFAMIVATLFTMLFYLLSVSLLWREGNFSQFLPSMGVIWASGLIVAIFALLILNLVILHIYLQCLGISTYNFIMMDKIPTSKPKSQEITEQELEQTKTPVKHSAQEMVAGEVIDRTTGEQEHTNQTNENRSKEQSVVSKN